jgi:hypothetical protein
MFAAVCEHASSAAPHVKVRTEDEPDGSTRYRVDSDQTGITKKVYWTDYDIVRKEPQ